MNEPTEDTILRNAAVIPFALLGGATLFLVVVGVVTLSSPSSEREGTDPLVMILLTLGLWLVLQIAGTVVKNVREPLLLEENPAAHYFQSVIIKMGLLEGPTLFGCVALLICLPGNLDPFDVRLLLLLIPYFSMLGSILLQRPGRDDFEHRVRMAEENASMRSKQSSHQP